MKDRKEKGCPLALLIHLCARGGKLNNGQLSTAAFFFFFVIDIKASKTRGVFVSVDLLLFLLLSVFLCKRSLLFTEVNQVWIAKEKLKNHI